MFIFPPVVVLYFDLVPNTLPGILAAFAVVAVPLLYTTPHRYGICVALDWLTRAEDDAEAISYPSGSSSAPPTQDPEPERDRG